MDRNPPDTHASLDSNGHAEIAFLRERVRAAALPDDVQASAELELARLERLPVASIEYGLVRSYFDWLLALPWDRRTEDQLDVKATRHHLDAGHFGLDHAKEEIAHHLAAMKLRGDGLAPTLCLVGPAGSGKTSLGHSIARLLGRQLVRVSLRTTADESDILGQRHTLADAMPGKIMRGIRRAGVRNPVFIVEEIDRLGTRGHGDVAAALFEALDPKARSRFTDHYLDVPFDLSEVLFITTAGLFEQVPETVADCLEPVFLPGYVQEEKCQIARQYLLPREREKCGLSEDQFDVDDFAITQLVAATSSEAGVSALKSRLGAMTRRAALAVAGGEGPVRLVAEDLPRWTELTGGDVTEQSPEVGLARALVITRGGAAVSYIEVTRVPGRAEMTLTGPQSEQRRELVQTALTIVRASAKRYDIDPKLIEATHLHVHFHDELAQSDLSSVGLAIVAALMSAFTGKPVRADVGLTGNISLRGRLRNVPSVVGKVLAARRSELSHVVIPSDSTGALERLPDYVRDAVQVHGVTTVEEALDLALLQIIVPKPEDASAIGLLQSDIPPNGQSQQNAGGG